jgi:ATP-dependent exoDNAse (exonuclease V) beta subunit
MKAEIEELVGEDYQQNVMGIREAKGLEFHQVLLLDFFTRMPDDSHRKAWKTLLLDADVYGGVRLESIPATMELDLKLLYTAITRSRDRLFFVETGESSAFEAFCRCLKMHDFAKLMKAEDMASEGSVMTADDWTIEGIDAACLAGDSEPDDAKSHLIRAIGSFRRADNKEMEVKAESHLKALELASEAMEASMMTVGIPQQLSWPFWMRA